MRDNLLLNYLQFWPQQEQDGSLPPNYIEGVDSSIQQMLQSSIHQQKTTPILLTPI